MKAGPLPIHSSLGALIAAGMLSPRQLIASIFCECFLGVCLMLLYGAYALA